MKLKHYNSEILSRKKIAVKYANEINNKLICTPISQDLIPHQIKHHVFHLYVIKVRDRNRFQAYMEKKGIGTMIHYPIPPHKQRAYFDYSSLSLPITEKIHQEVISLPIGPTMKTKDIDTIINAVNAYTG